MSVFEWPREVLRHSRVSFFIAWTSRDVGRSLAGRPQVVGGDAGEWQIQMQLPIEPSPELIKQFEALTSRMRGRQNAALIPICDPLRYSSAVSPNQTPFDDGEYFSDGKGFLAGGASSLNVAAAAGVLAESIQVVLTSPKKPAPRIGDMFSHDNFLYRVIDVSGSTVSILPPLRRAIPAGATLTTDPPMIRVKFASDDEARRAREMNRFGEATALTFVEDFDR